MKKILVYGLLLISVFTLFGCNKVKVETDALKFKNEYESLNGTENASGKTYRSILIDEDNPMVYATAEEVVNMINDGETFVIYFGFKTCPWCRSVLPTLIEVAKDLDIKKIYYVDILDIRDTLALEDGKVVTSKEGSSDYYELIKLLDKVLDKYTLTDEKGKEVDTLEKRIYAPNVVSIVKGVPEKLETGISEKQTDAYMELTDEMLNETKEKFECVLNCVKDDTVACKVGC